MIDKDDRSGILRLSSLSPSCSMAAKIVGPASGANGTLALAFADLLPGKDPQTHIEVEIVRALQTPVVYHRAIDSRHRPSGKLSGQLRHGYVVTLAPSQTGLKLIFYT
jgi:hypothetical protein